MSRFFISLESVRGYVDNWLSGGKYATIRGMINNATNFLGSRRAEGFR